MILSLCMITKDEEGNIRRCLESVKYIADEIIVVDTGSKDKTVEIAKSIGARVFDFKWTGSFSEARNYSLSQAEGDWIMIMDADEEMGEYEPEKIRGLMDDTEADAYYFETISYIGDGPGEDAVMSMNLRLLKNNKGYYYVNPIHEQIYGVIMALNPGAKIINKDYKVYHYGYLTRNIENKNKRQRNTAILEKELMLSPDYGFALYNMGSEYCAMEDYEKALEYFEKAYKSFDPAEGFASVMIFKMANCYTFLSRYDEALKLCDIGLKYFPRFTDLEYIKGVIYIETQRNEIAAECFLKCCEMGEAPDFLNVIVGAGTFRPLLELGEVYLEKGDCEAAILSLEKCLKLNPVFKEALILLIRAYRVLKTDEGEIRRVTENHIEAMPGAAKRRLIDELKI